MTIELLQQLALACFVIAGILLAVTILLFFVLRIPEVYGDLSGRTARKAIEDIRQKNERGEKIALKHMENGRVRKTDKISPSGNLIHQTSGIEVASVTEKIDTVFLTSDGRNSQETELLQPGGSITNETVLLNNNEGSDETTLLSQPQQKYGVEYEITFMESTEIIA